MRIGIVILFIFILATNGRIYGQSFVQLVEYADEKMVEGDYIEALDYYQRAMQFDSTSIEILWKYAEANRHFKNYKKAERYYKIVFNKESARVYPMSIFWLATMQHYNGKYARAVRSWKSAKKVYKRDRDSYLYLKSVQEMKSCLWAQKASRDTSRIDLESIGLPINSKDAELAPVLLEDRIIFTALKADSVKITEEVISNDYSLQLYQSERKAEAFSVPEPLKGTYEKGMHSANGTVSLDGKRFYFSRCDQNLNCKIYVGKIKDDKIVDIDSLGDIINYEDAITTMPHIASVDGRECLFFVSDRPHSFGGLDIWYAFIEDGNQFSLPQSLGEDINTPDDDITPFYDSENKKLYFSSSWHSGFGGHDIFSAQKREDDMTFESLHNLGLPINSSKNDTYFGIDSKDGDYYLSSNREGVNYAKNPTCCNDIFVVRKEEDPPSERFSNLEELNRKLPVTLYFHNDEPNPRTTDTVTHLSYKQTYDSYIDLLPKYKKEYSKGLIGDDAEEAKEDISDFFVEYVEQGLLDLEEFTRLLLIELNKGNSLVITIKGFASPLAKSDYNVNLTKRRIHSFVNYLEAYGSGEFKSYIDSKALTFVQIPYGEYTASTLISDNVNDQKNSVYNRKAGLERKIEIQSVTIDKDAGGKGIKFDKMIHDFGVVEKDMVMSSVFSLTNNTDSTISISNLINECRCITSEADTYIVEPGQSTKITVRFNSANQKGLVIRRVLILYDEGKKSQEIAITSEVK